jgi:TPR repeat protein
LINLELFGQLFEMDSPSEPFEMRAQGGDANAQFHYAVRLADGDGIAMDKLLAAHYYKLSADQGHPDAQFSYGVLLA